jgi:hypothetical protein
MPPSKRKIGRISGNGEKREEEGGNSKRSGHGIGFGNVLQEALQRRGPSKGSKVKGSQERKQRAEENIAREEKKLLVEKRKWFQKEHAVPEAADLNHEKLLLKLATKGVVKLFNVIQQQQKSRIEGNHKTDKAPKPDKMTKTGFLSLLKAGGQVSEREAPGQKHRLEEMEEMEEEEAEEDDDGGLEVEEEGESDSGGELEVEDDEEEWE